MNIQEYEIIKNYNYKEYCDYLKKKYGEAKYDYFTRSFVKNNKVTRTKEGLICHHICEDTAIQLSTPEFAKKNPFEYQLAENLCYCDYLEHLFLHILICENPSPNKNMFEVVGIGGIIDFIVPELNDVYSGWITKQNWRLYCHNKIKNDKDVYLILLKRFKDNCNKNVLYKDGCLYTSFNEKFGLRKKENNKGIFEEISKYLEENYSLEYT